VVPPPRGKSDLLDEIFCEVVTCVPESNTDQRHSSGTFQGKDPTGSGFLTQSTIRPNGPDWREKEI
jgi:hypothetical protein